MILRGMDPTLVVNDIRYSGKYSARLALEEHIVVSQRTSANELLSLTRGTCENEIKRCLRNIRV